MIAPKPAAPSAAGFALPCFAALLRYTVVGAQQSSAFGDCESAIKILVVDRTLE
jgi:hypothetical protein